MYIRRWAMRLHKWIALVVGLQVLLWISGGLVMSAIPIGIVRGEHKIASPAVSTFSPEELQSLGDIADRAGLGSIKSASAGLMLGEPVWRIETPDKLYTFDAASGEQLSPISESLARQIADADYGWGAPVVAAKLLDDPPAEYGRAGPVWQIRFDDADATTLYVDATSGDVRARRSTTWRFYDFFWKLHVMDYDDGASFNHPLIITAAGTALVFALSGLTLLFIRMRQFVRTRRRLQDIDAQTS